jgi:hypothetical protein
MRSSPVRGNASPLFDVLKFRLSARQRVRSGPDDASRTTPIALS